MHKTAARSVIARTNLHVKSPPDKKVPRGMFCKVEFCILDDEAQDVILQENERIDIYS